MMMLIGIWRSLEPSVSMDGKMREVLVVVLLGLEDLEEGDNGGGEEEVQEAYLV